MAHERDSRSRRLVTFGTLIVMAASLGYGLTTARAGTGRNLIHDDRRDRGDSGLLLVEYFRLLVADQDFRAFEARVSAHYREEALGRLLAESPSVDTRRAAAAALGITGSFRGSNAALGRALRDEDPLVRQLAQGSLWSVWYRADTPANNDRLDQVRALIQDGELHRAEELANHLISIAPGFAEAYNQRAIIYFSEAKYAESARDCGVVLSINPYHFGALGGLAQCQLRLNRPDEAVRTLRRALRLQPYDTDLRRFILMIESREAQAGDG